MKKVGELTFLQHFAERFKLPAPEFEIDSVPQSRLKNRLEKWGEGIVKPDVLAGKRGKAGVIRTVTDPGEGIKLMKQIAATEINGLQPRSAYIVQSVPADFEIFTAVSYNSSTLSPCFTISLKGGMDIESVAEKDKITVPVNVFQGLDSYQVSDALTQLGLEGKLNSSLAIIFVNLWDMFISTGMSSCEINPWRVTRDGMVYACDFKATFDSNNFKTQDIGLEWPEYPTTETAFETEMHSWAASSHQGQAHVSALGGKSILPILFGGGASTIVTETLAMLGGDPIFLSDFGGNPPYERMKQTAAICFKHHLAEASLLLILGGKANNTLIDVTFSAIADALQEYVDDNEQVDIPVIIGRGGQHLIQGFSSLKKVLDDLGMPHVIFGPDTPITLVAEYAAKLAKVQEVKK